MNKELRKYKELIRRYPVKVLVVIGLNLFLAFIFFLAIDFLRGLYVSWGSSGVGLFVFLLLVIVREYYGLVDVTTFIGECIKR